MSIATPLLPKTTSGLILPLDFETSGLFGPATRDTAVMAHEVGKWMDDPLGTNPTPAWGHVGQVGGCQSNLEIGDPLSGIDIPTVTMPNGFTYHLQELASSPGSTAPLRSVLAVYSLTMARSKRMRGRSASEHLRRKQLGNLKMENVDDHIGSAVQQNNVSRNQNVRAIRRRRR
jgi:hypothetical protein